MKRSEYEPHLSPFLERMWRTEEFKIKELTYGDGELEGVFVPKARHRVTLYCRWLKRKILTGKDRPDFLSYFCGERLCGVLAIILLGKSLKKDCKDADVYALESQMSCREHLPFTHDGEVRGRVRLKAVEEMERYHRCDLDYFLGENEEFIGSITVAYMKKH